MCTDVIWHLQTSSWLKYAGHCPGLDSFLGTRHEICWAPVKFVDALLRGVSQVSWSRIHAKRMNHSARILTFNNRVRSFSLNAFCPTFPPKTTFCHNVLITIILKLSSDRHVHIRQTLKWVRKCRLQSCQTWTLCISCDCGTAVIASPFNNPNSEWV